MMDYDVSDEFVDLACSITPGLESPTVSPLAKEGWHAVRAMVPAGARAADHGRPLGGRRSGHPGHRHRRLPDLTPWVHGDRAGPAGLSPAAADDLGDRWPRSRWSACALFGWFALPPILRAQFTLSQIVTLLGILVGLVFAMVIIASSYVRVDADGPADPQRSGPAPGRVVAGAQVPAAAG